MTATLVIFCGLPGTGKSTLANPLARALRWPLLPIDDLTVAVPADAGPAFWDEKILVLLTLAETQLQLGLSVVLDSVFMGRDRLHAQELARTYHAIFRPVYCFVSDETLWRQRVTQRAEMLQNPAVATWDGIQHQREHFAAWEADTGLLVDAVLPFEHNYATVHKYVTEQDISLVSMKIPDEGLTKGRYHA